MSTFSRVTSFLAILVGCVVLVGWTLDVGVLERVRSSGYMGAARMAQMCARLEEIGAFGELSRAPELLDAIEMEFGRVRPALTAAIAKN